MHPVYSLDLPSFAGEQSVSDILQYCVAVTLSEAPLLVSFLSSCITVISKWEKQDIQQSISIGDTTACE